jgi:hypothetical protein
MDTKLQTAISDTKRQMLRHVVATLAYRGSKALRGAPAGFAGFCAAEGSRSPVQILAHVGDLVDWALSLAQGRQAWHESAPRPWEEEVQRWYSALGALDAYLGSGSSLKAPEEKLFQGPLADALTHIGQIAMLRRLAGAPMRGENYLRAEIAVGRVGEDQAAAVREFDQ